MQNLNPYFQELDVDYLYHLGIESGDELISEFNNIRFVIFTRSFSNAKVIAHNFAKRWYNIREDGFELTPIHKTERFHMYKIGPVLILAHGIGTPTMLIALNEVSKLLVHAGCQDVMFFRIGPSGGLGLNIGDVVVSSAAVNNSFLPIFETIECGEIKYHSSSLDQSIYDEILARHSHSHEFNVVLGKTIGSNDYYEGQARFNGALPPPYTQTEQQEYLQKAQANGVKSFDMEAVGFAGFCNQLGIKACLINAIYVNRLQSDVVDAPTKTREQALSNALDVALNYILYKLAHTGVKNDN